MKMIFLLIIQFFLHNHLKISMIIDFDLSQLCNLKVGWKVFHVVYESSKSAIHPQQTLRFLQIIPS